MAQMAWMAQMARTAFLDGTHRMDDVLSIACMWYRNLIPQQLEFDMTHLSLMRSTDPHTNRPISRREGGDDIAGLEKFGDFQV